MKSAVAKLLSWLGAGRGVGERGERAAMRHLRKQSYRVLARNLRNRFGEIDLLAEAPDRRTIVLVEVKTSESDTTHTGPRPEERVNRVKQRKLMALAAQAARQYGLTDRPIRFDVVGVDLPPRGKPCVRHHVGAFESSY